ncbi:MAG: response regulator transcription factor [Polynucleobacter sp.]
MINKRIHIVDDELVIRESIGGWLSKKYEVFSYASGEEYLEATKKFNPKDQTLTCLLLDFQMTGINGVELQNQLKHLDDNFSIIFMSGNAHQSDIIDAWHGGAIDFLLKPFSPIKINELLDKQFSIMEQRIDTKIESLSPEVKISITKREAEVLLLLGGGSPQREVGQQLGISLSTVKMYRSFLKDKLGLNTLTELIRYCDSHLKSIKKIAGQ